MDIHDIQQKFKKMHLRHRPSQLHMIEQVAQSIEKKQILCIEAPTGTGKTLSYLIASEIAKTSSQKVIISTATITLQEQLASKDLPLLEVLLDKKINYAIAKGRQNYLCLAKLQREIEEPDLFSESDFILDLQNQAANPFWNGDKEDLASFIPDPAWSRVTTNSSGCSNKRCEHYDQCYFFKARAKIYSADFIITNHNLLLSDMELGSGVLLPEPKNNIYIIDECHHFPQRAIAHFSKTVPLLGAVEWINQVSLNVQRAIASKYLLPTWQQKINHCTLSLTALLKQLKTELDLNSAHFVDGLWRMTPLAQAPFEVIHPLIDLSQEINRHCESIQTTLENEAEFISDKKSEAHQEISKQITQFKFITSKANDFLATWNLFSQTQSGKQPPIARWFEKINDDYRCHASPINVSQSLKDLFWDKVVNGALLCSATIRSLGSFDNFLRKTGLKLRGAMITETMPPIFNYQHSVIFIPKMQHEPSGHHQQAHRQEALSLLEQLILPKSGTLVLFGSHSAMQETFQRLRADLAKQVLMQGQHNRLKLIELHKKRIDQGSSSILFGLASFAEGIDLPAAYCQHVIIHKLPFSVPSDPVELTRAEWMNHHQLNPFQLATLPETSMRLTQYVGRLIRQEDDIGIVSILDRRLYSKNYGKQLLQDLPPFARLVNASVETLKQQPRIAELFQQE